MSDDRLVTAAAEAVANIDRYQTELGASPELQNLMAYARGWYGHRAADGRWRVAPSKYVGYAANDADVRTREVRDGRRTERILAEWFQELEPGTAVYDDVLAQLRDLFAAYGRTPNKLFRLSILRSSLGVEASGGAPGSAGGVQGDRVTIHPEICGGRPTIRGMRIRVSDILDLLASGSGRTEILADYPYLENEDISAALDYAARSIDHRVLRVA